MENGIDLSKYQEQALDSFFSALLVVGALANIGKPALDMTEQYLNRAIAHVALKIPGIRNIV